MTEVLLPCPFCGGVAHHDRYQDYDAGRREEGWQVSTVACHGCEVGFTCYTAEQAIAAWNARHRTAGQAELVNDIAVMMSEFVTNWPPHKKVSTSLALIAKTLRAALNPPKHIFWGAGEVDCPSDIKAPNGELHTLRCKACHADNPKDDRCFPKDAALAPLSQAGEKSS